MGGGLIKRVAAAALAAGWLLASAPASAAVIFDSGPRSGPSGACLCNDQFLAGRLGFSADAVITDIEAEIYGSGAIIVSLLEDGPNGLPGVELYRLRVPLSVAASDWGWNGAHGLSWDIGPGTYWFAFTVDRPHDSFFGGMGGRTPVKAAWAIDRGAGTGWQDLGIAAISLRVSGDGGGIVGPGIPEPAAWALMILGFGLAGGALRRRTALA